MKTNQFTIQSRVLQSTVGRTRLIIGNRIGPRTLYKSLQAHSAEAGHRFGKILIDGRTKVSIDKSAKIINNGYLTMGMHRQGFFPASRPCSLFMAENSKLVVNGTVNLARGVIIEVQKGATLTLNNVPINSNTSIICTCSIEIGDNTGIGWDVEICDTAFHKICGASRAEPIRIGRHVLICSHSVIMKGVTVGDGAVIAAGSIVTKDIPPESLAGGIPAKVIKENIEWEQ